MATRNAALAINLQLKRHEKETTKSIFNKSKIYLFARLPRLTINIVVYCVTWNITRKYDNDNDGDVEEEEEEGGARAAAAAVKSMTEQWKEWTKTSDVVWVVRVT